MQNSNRMRTVQTNNRIASMTAGFNKRLSALRQRQEAQRGVGLAAIGGGVILGGQVAQRKLFLDDNGNSRASYVNFAAGALGGFMLVSGRARDEAEMVGACVAIGMGLAQLAIKSYTEWHFFPKWGDGE